MEGPAAMDKREALKGWQGTPDDQNRLFFQARNLAIEALCLGLENRFLRAGLPVKVQWKESSFSSVSLRMTLENPKAGQAWTEFTCSILIKRTTIEGPSHLSQCFYAYQGAMFPGGRQPALVAQLSTLFHEMVHTGEIAERILRVNYPFEYTGHSVF